MFRYLFSNTSPQEMKVPEIRSLSITSNIQYRYAHTLVCSKVHNAAETAQEVEFNMTIPETAFITSFCLEIDGKVYDAYVKEKEEALKVYKEAVQQRRTAAHISVNPRDSNRFTVSVNIEPSKDITFHLKYEELLIRKLGTYKHVINLDPGQIIPDFKVEVNIRESTDITSLRVPELKDNDEIQPEADTSNTFATIERPNAHTAVIKFSPTPEQQKTMHENGIKGQLIVQYDVDRKASSSQLLVSDGYFAHYFAPEELKPLPKHVTFVLDASGSMSGLKIKQLKEAMEKILSDLYSEDYFSLLAFSFETQVWRLIGDGKWDNATLMESDWKSLVVPVNKTNVLRGKLTIQKLRAAGGTNISGAMTIATHIAQLGKNIVLDSESKPPEPIIIFLTDGQPTAGVCNINEIIDEITRLNQKTKATIFTLGLGRDVDFNFLKKLALRNSGFCRKIYEASDTALQLTNFYKEVASPLVSDINFIYQPEQVNLTSLTTHIFSTYFDGTELIVCGHIDPKKEKDFHFNVTGLTTEGKRNFETLDTSMVFITDDHMQKGFMERLWAYLTIQQLLEEEKKLDGKLAEEKKKQATQLALKYSFVTPVTSLVVVKPEDNQDNQSEVKESDELEEDFVMLNNYGPVMLDSIRCKIAAGRPRMACSDGISDTHDGFIVYDCDTEEPYWEDRKQSYSRQRSHSRDRWPHNLRSCSPEKILHFHKVTSRSPEARSCSPKRRSRSLERSYSSERISRSSERRSHSPVRSCSPERRPCSPERSGSREKSHSSERCSLSPQRIIHSHEKSLASHDSSNLYKRRSCVSEKKGRTSPSDISHPPKRAKQGFTSMSWVMPKLEPQENEGVRFLDCVKYKKHRKISPELLQQKVLGDPEKKLTSIDGKNITMEKIVDACFDEIILEGNLPSNVTQIERIEEMITHNDRVNRIKFDMSYVHNKIHEKSIEYKSILQEEIGKSAVFLKFDCMKSQDLQLLCVYLQFIADGKVTIRTLGLWTLDTCCSIQKLQDIIKNKLEQFCIKPEHVLCSVVSDENEGHLADIFLTGPKFKDSIIMALHGLGIPASHCPTEVLQLAMYDTIAEMHDIILQVRYIATKLKPPDHMNYTGMSNQEALDWYGTDKLLSDFETLNKEYEKHNFTDPDLLLNKQEKDMIADADKTLRYSPLLELLKAKHLLFGDYYGEWIDYAEAIAKQGSSFNETLSRNMKKRASEVLEDPIFLVQLFFDSRFKSILNVNQERSAAEKLKNLWLHLAEITKDSELSNVDIVDKVKQFRSTSKTTKGKCLLDYWESQKKSEPELYKLATALMSVPISKRTENAVFSNTELVLSPLAQNLKEDIVFVRCFKMATKA